MRHISTRANQNVYIIDFIWIISYYERHSKPCGNVQHRIGESSETGRTSV